MPWEVAIEYIKELHESGRDVFGQSDFGVERGGIPQSAQQFRAQGTWKGSLSSGLTNSQEPRRQWIEAGTVEFMKFAICIDEDASLLGKLGLVVVPDSIVGEIIDDFQCQEEARRVHVGIPVEDRTIDDLNMVDVPASIERVPQVLHLKAG